MQTINLAKAKDIIFSTGGLTFGVKFIKKDGIHRTMSCRFGVKQHLKGGELKYKPNEYGLLGVYDMNKTYRMVNLKTLYYLKFADVEYKVVPSIGELVTAATKSAKNPRVRYQYGRFSNPY